MMSTIAGRIGDGMISTMYNVPALCAFGSVVALNGYFRYTLIKYIDENMEQNNIAKYLKFLINGVGIMLPCNVAYYCLRKSSYKANHMGTNKITNILVEEFIPYLCASIVNSVTYCLISKQIVCHFTFH